MRFSASSMLPSRLSTVSVSTPGSMPSFGAVICFSFSVAIWLSMLADVLAQALDLLLHVDDGHVGDDAER